MTNFLLTALAVSLILNLSLFLVAFRFQTDRLTDASYGITFIILAIYGFVTCHATKFHLLILWMVIIWAVRLSGFLLYRIWQKKKDARFDEMRHSFWLFGRFWLMQGLAVWVILIAGLLGLHLHVSVSGKLAATGFLIWSTGLIIESIADIQKYRFSINTKPHDPWIATGLWKYSRHPNYLGEIMVWVGMYALVFESLSTMGRLVGLVSPLFIIILLLFVSGIPILEKSADKRWGKLKEYKAYKARTSVLLLLPNKK